MDSFLSRRARSPPPAAALAQAGPDDAPHDDDDEAWRGTYFRGKGKLLGWVEKAHAAADAGPEMAARRKETAP